MTRVLADRDAAGADYIDLRIPGRPAAGGLPVQTVEPVAPADSDAQTAPPAAAEQAPAPTEPQATTPAPVPTPTPVAPQPGAEGVQP